MTQPTRHLASMSAHRGSSRVRATTLIIADAAGVGHSLLSDHIAGPWGSSITVRHPLEVIRCLQDESRTVDTIFYPVDDLAFETGGVSVFLTDEFPSVYRIGYGKDGLIHRVSTSNRPHAALDRCVRLRVSELVAAMGFSKEDAEDIVQDTLLAWFLGRESLRAVDLEAWLVALTAKTASDRERGNQRRARLRVAAVSEAAICRSSRESAGRPDAALLTAELAHLANVAVGGLPGWCRARSGYVFCRSRAPGRHSPRPAPSHSGHVAG